MRKTWLVALAVSLALQSVPLAARDGDQHRSEKVSDYFQFSSIVITTLIVGAIILLTADGGDATPASP